jgi:hypothetical protein
MRKLTPSQREQASLMDARNHPTVRRGTPYLRGTTFYLALILVALGIIVLVRELTPLPVLAAVACFVSWFSSPPGPTRLTPCSLAWTSSHSARANRGDDLSRHRIDHRLCSFSREVSPGHLLSDQAEPSHTVFLTVPRGAGLSGDPVAHCYVFHSELRVKMRDHGRLRHYAERR